jgi:hypothetical protein
MICNVFPDFQLLGPGLPAQYYRVPGVSGVQAFCSDFVYRHLASRCPPMSDKSVKSRADEQWMPAVRIAGLLFALLTAGCAGLERVPAGEPAQRGATPAVAPEPVAAPATSMGEPPQPAATPAATVAPAPVVPAAAATQKPPQPVATSGATVDLKPKVPPSVPSAPRSTGQPAAMTPAKVLASPAQTGQLSKKESAAPGLAKQDASPPLDLKSLETRLKETKAIGVFTKLALKNQVDDLLNQFRAYYQGRLKTTLAELRRPYEMLLLKVLALLQDTDPPLAGAIVASREAIWGILADPAKFGTI